jgi:hydroxymethylpyrimidine/phosphomethylpyrimidine kinase
MLPIALTIAGSDPSGGAGIQADLKTFHQFGVYGEAVITLVTAQNTVQVSRAEVMSADLVADQIRAVVGDMPPAAAKTGALGDAQVVEAVSTAAASFSFPLVVDPVMISKHGKALLDDEAIEALRRRLLPLAALVTPNLPEASRLVGVEVSSIETMRHAAQRLVALGAKAALVKGGHLAESATDILFDGRSFQEFRAPRQATPHTHGTGCTYAAAIAAELARGASLEAAVRRAKAFVTEAIATSPGLGHGSGPVNHFAPVR